MKDRVIAAVASLGLPPEAFTFLLSALPITELRASIPVAHALFGLPFHAAFFWAFLGSLVPGLLILYFGERLLALAEKEKFLFSGALWRKFEKTRRRFEKDYRRHGELGLVAFVSVPLPFTGVWTGSLAAVLFGIPLRRAFPLIAVGNAFAGMAVTLGSAGLFGLSRL